MKNFLDASYSSNEFLLELSLGGVEGQEIHKHIIMGAKKNSKVDYYFNARDHHASVG
jgi:hypothetical protein